MLTTFLRNILRKIVIYNRRHYIKDIPMWVSSPSKDFGTYLSFFYSSSVQLCASPPRPTQGSVLLVLNWISDPINRNHRKHLICVFSSNRRIVFRPYNVSIITCEMKCLTNRRRYYQIRQPAKLHHHKINSYYVMNIVNHDSSNSMILESYANATQPSSYKGI